MNIRSVLADPFPFPSKLLSSFSRDARAYRIDKIATRTESPYMPFCTFIARKNSYGKALCSN